MAGELDDLVVVVGGDISPLQNALQGIPEAMAGVSTAAADAFAGLDATLQKTATASMQAGDALATIGAQAQKAGGDTAIVDDAMKKLADSAQNAGQSAKTAADGWMSLSPALKSAGDAAQQTSLSFGEIGKFATAFTGIQIGVEALIGGLKELAESAVGTFSQIERSTLALTALTGSVEVANDQIDRLKSLAVSEALSFPELVSANQRMIAMGFSTQQTSASLKAAADASAATGVGLQQVMNSLERMSESGSVAARQLATLGLSMQDLARAEGTTTENAKAMFQSLDPQGRLDVLITALEKYQGTAQALVTSLSGQFQQLKNQLLLSIEPLGEALAPALKSIMSEIQTDVLPGIRALIAGFSDVASAAGPSLTGVLTSLIRQFGQTTEAIGNVLTALSNLPKVVVVAVDQVVPGFKATADAVGASDVSMSGLLRTATAFSSFGLSELVPAINKAAEQFKDLSGKIDGVALSVSRFNDATYKLKTQVDDLALATRAAQGPMVAIRTEFLNEQDAVEQARKALANMEQAKRDGIASDGMVQRAQEALNKALYDMDPAAKAAADAAKRMADSIQTIVDKSNLLLRELPTNIEEVQHAFETTGETVKSDLSKVESELQNLKNKMIEIDGATTDMLKTWGNLQQARDQLKLLAATQDWINIKTKINDLTKAMDDQGGATKQQLDELAKYQQKLNDAADGVKKLGGSVDQLVQDSQGKWHVIIGPIQQTNDAIQVINGSFKNTAAASNEASLGITVLTSKTNDNTSATKGASAAQTELGVVFTTTSERAKAAADAAAGMAKAMENVAAASKDAADSMEAALAASNALAHSFAVTGFGGGPGGSASAGGQIGVRPGDVITQRGEAGQIISQNTIPGAPQAKLFDVNGKVMMLTEEQAQALQDMGNSVASVTKHLNAAADAVANLGTAATQSASSLVSAATSIANSLTSATTPLAAATDQLNKATDAYDAIAAAYQAGTASADQMRIAQDALNAAYKEFVASGGAIQMVSDSMGSLSTAVSTTADTIVAAATTIADATTAAANGITAIVVPAVEAVQTAVGKVLGSNSTTLLPPVGGVPTTPSPAGTLGYNTSTFAGIGGLRGPGTIQMNVNIQGGGGAAVGRDIVNTLNAMGAKVQS